MMGGEFPRGPNRSLPIPQGRVLALQYLHNCITFEPGNKRNGVGFQAPGDIGAQRGVAEESPPVPRVFHGVHQLAAVLPVNLQRDF